MAWEPTLPIDPTNKAVRVQVVGGALSGATTFFGITESSTGNGTSPTLTLGHTPTDEPRIFVARIRQILGTDYTRVGPVITWITIPASGDSIQVDYTWSLASATLSSTLVVDVNGNVQPTGDSSARSIHVTVDSSALPTGAALDATLSSVLAAILNGPALEQRIACDQAANQRAQLQAMASASGQAVFLNEIPAFLAGV